VPGQPLNERPLGSTIHSLAEDTHSLIEFKTPLVFEILEKIGMGHFNVKVNPRVQSGY